MTFDPSLYLVLDPSMTRRQSVQDILSEAVHGGVSLVQVREKNCSDDEFQALARAAADVLRATDVPLIVNDRLDVAVAIGAQGLHIGQSDVHWREARRILGPDAILGLSVESMEQARAAEMAGVDYLGVSSVFATQTKKDIRHVWTLDGLRQLREESRHRLVGIGGIERHNAESVLAAGADGLAIVSAICRANDVRAEAAEFRLLIENFRGENR